MTNAVDLLPAKLVCRVRTAYLNRIPLSEIADRYGLKLHQVAELTRRFRQEVTGDKKRPGERCGIQKIVMPGSASIEDRWYVPPVSLPRISMHVAVLRERGHAEI